MPTKMTAAAMDGPVAPTADAAGLADHIRKGDPIEVYPGTYGWGRKETLPTIIRVTITDKEKAEVDGYLDQVVKLFKYTIVAQNAQGVRARVEVDDAVTGLNFPGVKQEIKDYILNGADVEVPVTQVSQTASEIVVDIELPDDANRTPTLKQMQSNINDVGSEVIVKRRYYFESAAVDSVVSGGGETSITAAQAINNIIDRLA